MIRLHTDGYVLQTMTRDLVSEAWRRWAGDAALMRSINSARMEVSLPELRTYAAGFDNRTRLLVGVFDRADMTHRGVYEIDIQPFHRTATLQVLIGSGPVPRIRTEADKALLDLLFSRGIEKVVIRIPAYEQRQAKLLERIGYVREGYLREERRRPERRERVDYVQYGLLKANWADQAG